MLKIYQEHWKMMSFLYEENERVRKWSEKEYTENNKKKNQVQDVPSPMALKCHLWILSLYSWHRSTWRDYNIAIWYCIFLFSRGSSKWHMFLTGTDLCLDLVWPWPHLNFQLLIYIKICFVSVSLTQLVGTSHILCRS
jgi:hypothetical protein